MKENKTSGCLVAVFVGVVLVFALAAGGVIWLVSARKEQAREREEALQRELAHQMAFASTSNDEQEMVRLEADEIGGYSPGDFGDELTREHFVALVADQKATELARRTFVERANGQQVSWLLKTEDVRESPGGSGPLLATFALPYRIQSSRNSWSGSTLRIEAEFPADQRDRLMEVRRDDWVTIEGRLEFEDSGNARLVDARVLSRAEAR